MCAIGTLLCMDTTGHECVIRRMRREEFPLAIEWAGNEGWNPGVHDDDCFFSADPEGFFVAETDDTPVGMISMVCYDDRFAFAGLYIVKPEFRRQGCGMKLYQAAVGRAGNRIVGGDAVVAMVDQYETRTGLRQAYHNIRFEGTGGGIVPEGLASLRRIPFDRVLEYDRRHFPATRARFLRCWISREGTEALAKLDDRGNLLGYGVRRTCLRGHKIGPLFADTPAIAEDLFNGLSAAVPSEPVFLDVPAPNKAALDLAKRHGMTAVFETARMYIGPAPALPLAEIFGVTSFELG